MAAEIVEEKPPNGAVCPSPDRPVIVGDRLRARDVIRETVRMSVRDLLPCVALICVAGAAAQILNLGGTFLLALIHDVDIVAALFLMCAVLEAHCGSWRGSR